MSVDSKMFVVCKPEEKMSIVKEVLSALDKLAKQVLKEDAKQANMTPLELKHDVPEKSYTFGAGLESYDFESFTILFGVGDTQQRMFWVHTTCDSDIQEYLKEGEAAVKMSIGCWGSYHLIINHVAEALKELGNDVYVDYNDSDDVEYAKYQNNGENNGKHTKHSYTNTDLAQHGKSN